MAVLTRKTSEEIFAGYELMTMPHTKVSGSFGKFVYQICFVFTKYLLQLPEIHRGITVRVEDKRIGILYLEILIKRPVVLLLERKLGANTGTTNTRQESQQLSRLLCQMNLGLFFCQAWRKHQEMKRSRGSTSLAFGFRTGYAGLNLKGLQWCYTCVVGSGRAVSQSLSACWLQHWFL